MITILEKHPCAIIVNICCGMDTTFSRVDNGKILFYELVIAKAALLRSAVSHIILVVFIWKHVGGIGNMIVIWLF